MAFSITIPVPTQIMGAVLFRQGKTVYEKLMDVLKFRDRLVFLLAPPNISLEAR
jgi:hypothetical protein